MRKVVALVRDKKGKERLLTFNFFQGIVKDEEGDLVGHMSLESMFLKDWIRWCIDNHMVVLDHYEEQ